MVHGPSSIFGNAIVCVSVGAKRDEEKKKKKREAVIESIMRTMQVLLCNKRVELEGQPRMLSRSRVFSPIGPSPL